MSSGMKGVIIVIVLIILLKHPDLISQIINGITKLVSG